MVKRFRINKDFSVIELQTTFYFNYFEQKKNIYFNFLVFLLQPNKSKT